MVRRAIIMYVYTEPPLPRSKDCFRVSFHSVVDFQCILYHQSLIVSFEY